MLKNSNLSIALIFLLLFTVFISGCGGGGGTSPTPPGDEILSKTGIAVDPYIKGAKFFIDSITENRLPDTDEIISGFSNDSGEFEFSTDIKKGHKVVMHPDFKGKHNGIDYSGPLLEGIAEENDNNGRVVFSPLTTIVSKYDLSREEVAEMINSAFAFTSEITASHILSDPMAHLPQNGEEPDHEQLRVIQAAIAVNGLLKLLEKPSVNSVISNEKKKDDIKELLIPIASDIKSVLSVGKFNKLKSIIPSEEPEFDINDLVKTAVSVNNKTVDTILSSVSGTTISDLKTSIESTIDTDENSINAVKLGIATYITDNFDSITDKNTIISNTATEIINAGGVDPTSFLNSVTQNTIISDKTYNLTLITDGNGTVTGAGLYSQGQTIEITATANTGYKFKEWTGDTEKLSGIMTGQGMAQNLSMPVEAVTLTANFEVDTNETFSLTLNNDGNGTVTGAGSYYLGQTIEITATANTGYKFKEWTGDTEKLSGIMTAQGTAQNLSMPVEAVTLTANFEVDTNETFSLTLNNDGNGTVTGAGLYSQGQTIEITATANTGYKFKEWTGDTEKLSGIMTAQGTAQNLSMPVEAVTLTANFEVDTNETFSLTLNNDGNGTITGAGSYYLGQTIEITATANTGYKFKEWTGDTEKLSGIMIGQGTVQNLSMPVEAVTLTANFEPDFAGGDGTSENPFQISTPAHLNNIRYFMDNYFVQTANIDLAHGIISSEEWYDGTKGWLPIGDSIYPFNGNYDGANYTILNIFIDRGTTNYNSLFGYCDEASINSLGIIDANVTGYEYTGVLAGYLSNGIISKCYVTGSVVGNSYNTGGLIGLANFSNTISDCYSMVDVEGFNNPSGFAGIGSGTISNCYASGNVSAISGSSSPDPKGFTGMTMGATINDCYWDTVTSGQATSEGGTGKTTAQMSQQSTFTGWDFGSIWAIDEGSSYPYLQIQTGENIPETGLFAGGDGTSGNPFQISTPAQLNNIRYFLTSYFILNNDIDLAHAILSSESWYDSTKGWDPISLNPSFKGELNGNNKIISNLYINRTDQEYIGLFGSLFTDSTVRNLILKDFEVSGTSNVGGLSGAGHGNIINVGTAGTVNSTGNNSGGIVGNFQNGIIENVYSVASVNGNNNVGGLFGVLMMATVSKSYYAGVLTGNY